MASKFKLTIDEQNEIAGIYALLDAEWRAAGKRTAPERAPFSVEDIREWRTLTAHERYLDLKGYARASDRVTAAQRTIELVAA